MTKFEKVRIKAELLECAYNAILSRDRWDNTVDGCADNSALKSGREEMHVYYMYIASLVEGLLNK